MAKKIWRKPEIKTMRAGEAENGTLNNRKDAQSTRS